MTKLGMHVQIGAESLLPILAEIRAPMNKTMDLDPSWVQRMRAASPESLLVGRAHVGHQDRYKTDPGGLIAEMLERYAPAVPWLNVIEVTNEVPHTHMSATDRAAFDAFQVAFAEAAWTRWPDIQIGLFQVPTGNLAWAGEPTLLDFPRSLALPKDKVYICLHEYSWYTWDWEAPARCLRYRRLMDGLTGYQVLITECGLTQAVLAGKPDVGWRSGIPREVFIDGAVWYDNELKQDDYVVGAAMFTCGTSYGWDSFECTAEWEEAVRRSAEKQPEFERPIRVLLGGQVHVMELEEYLRAVVPAEMPALWPKEALKAQAVAARTYAVWRRNNPRSEAFDLYNDTRDQVWDPDREHPRSDRAVLETVGETLDVLTRYVSRCGRADCPLCRGTGGHEGKTWNDRMCQYGAKTMAENGATWREILLHYYGIEPAQAQPIEIPNNGDDNMPNVTFYKDPATNSFQMQDGKVTGCRVDILKAEDTPGKPALQAGGSVYRVVNVRFLNEEQARGDTRILVQVLDRNGSSTMAKVVNAWPQQTMPRWDDQVYDWASPGHWAEFAQGSGNYDPAKHGPLGPYVIFVGADQTGAAVVSDWCVGFGLPGNRHVAYQVIYQEQIVGEEQTQPDVPTEPTASGCNLLLAAIARLLERWAQ